MRKSDDGLRQIIVSNLRTYRSETIFWQPIETALTATGVPDLYGCWRGTSVWIECKATSHWRVKITEFQVGWLMRLARAGGRGFVVVRRHLPHATTRRPAFDELWLVHSEQTPRLRAEGLISDSPYIGAMYEKIGTMYGEEANQWRWSEFAEALFEPCDC